MKTLAILLSIAALAGCSTTATELAYAPTASVSVQATPSVSAINVSDARDERDPHYIGAIRGGYGNPLKTLTTTQPVTDVVSAAFQAALRARGLYGPGGAASLAVTLKQLSGNWYVRREGHTIFALTLQDRAGRVLFEDEEDVLKVEGSIVSLNAGVFASIDDLHAIVVLSLSTAIDQALDKPGFRAALAALHGMPPST